MAYLCVLAVLLATLLPHPARAVEVDEIDQVTQSITHDYMSPFCPGLLLADCSSSNARALRGEIAARLRTGQPESAVREALEQRFGEVLRASPAPAGFGLLAWLTPIAFVVAGMVTLGLWIRRLGALPQQATGVERASPPVDAALLARFEAELQRTSG